MAKRMNTFCLFCKKDLFQTIDPASGLNLFYCPFCELGPLAFCINCISLLPLEKFIDGLCPGCIEENEMIGFII